VDWYTLLYVRERTAEIALNVLGATIQNELQVKEKSNKGMFNNCLLYTNICTNKYCKFILNYCYMFRCQYTIFRQFTVVLAEVMNY